MCTQNQLDKIMKQILEYSKDKFKDKFNCVILYGSYARGDYDAESDIDIMILADLSMEELKKYQWDFSCFCAEINIENSVFVTAKLQSLKMFDEWKRTLPFYQNVLRDGVKYA